MGGEIWVESRLGHGSAFQLRPAARHSSLISFCPLSPSRHIIRDRDESKYDEFRRMYHPTPWSASSAFDVSLRITLLSSSATYTVPSDTPLQNGAAQATGYGLRIITLSLNRRPAVAGITTAPITRRSSR